MKFSKNILLSLLKCKTAQSCIVCGEKTKFVEIVTKARICSEECIDKMIEHLKEKT
nr:MAG TPA: putative ATP-dependent RNA helicase [Caudoviricetes sp.]